MAHGVAAGQYGVISRAQALRCGIDRLQLRRLLYRGTWVRAYHGVYRVPGIERGTGRGRLLSATAAAQLALGPAAFVSAETAARLWGMQGLPPWDGVVHMTVPGADRRSGVSGITVHTWATDRAEITGRGGVRATSPGRTLRDTVLQVDRATALCLLDSALNRQLVAADALPGLAAANSRRPGATRTRPWWGLADGRAQSPLETRIRLLCADGGLPPDALQYPFYDVRGRLIAVGDLWWEDLRLLVEADGRGPHELPGALLHDRRRQNALQLACPGIRIARFTWADLEHPSYIPGAVRGAAGTHLMPVEPGMQHGAP
ncbi:hypothetical protein EKD16_23735 [Streptomonospora litoralis]|uniref:AbiEi antitoxin N-terminal domain-containing protein n=1 Tax=Streptomonospora litoralis TaxID=2498135 RepID=A0A4P6Q722_9ACTN|nr:hypothetical protein EKD16_23735 [Streptomonospora litoralis]